MSDDSPGSSSELDLRDLRILHTLRDQPLWKTKVHDRLDGRCSVQTVGRRIDKLADAGYLDSVMLSPDEVRRELIIGYRLTNDGEDALQQVRRCVLQDVVREEAFTDQRWHELDDAFLEALVIDELDVSDAARDELAACSRDDLVALLAFYFSREGVEDVVAERAAVSDVLTTRLSS